MVRAGALLIVLPGSRVLLRQRREVLCRGVHASRTAADSGKQSYAGNVCKWQPWSDGPDGRSALPPVQVRERLDIVKVRARSATDGLNAASIMPL